MRLACLVIAALLAFTAHAQMPPRTVADVFTQLDSKAVDPAVAASAKEVLAKPAPAGTDKEAHIAHHAARARAAASLGLVADTIEERKRLVALTEGERNQPKHLVDLAINSMTAGNWTEAEAYARRASTAPTAWWGQDIAAAALLARMQSFLGDVGSARMATERIEALFRRAMRQPQAAPFVELVGALIAWAQADTFLADGQAQAGERALRLAHERALADTKLADRRAASVEQSPAADATWQLLDLIETQLVRLHVQQGRLQEAEIAARAMIARNGARYGRTSPSTGIALAALGDVLLAQGRLREAAALADRAAQTIVASGGKAGSGYAFYAERVRIDARVGQSEWKEAVALIDGLRARVKDDAFMVLTTERQPAWALALVNAGRANDAAAWLSRLAAEHEKHLGPARYEAAESRGLLGAALAAQGERAKAFEAFGAALPVLTAPRRGAEADTEDALRRLKRRAIFEAYIGLLHDAQGERGAGALAEALQVADAGLAGSVQSALAASAARAMAGTPQLGDLIRGAQDAKRELANLNDRLLALSVAPDSEQRNKAVAEVRERMRTIEEARGASLQRIESQFPDYANLISPKPATLAEAQKALRPDEALVTIIAGESRTYVLVAGAAGRTAFHAAPLGRRELASLVASLRLALDPGEVTIERMRRFDYAAAQKLYAQLLQPVEAAWSGAQTLVTAVDPVLGQLPLSVLLTGPAPANRETLAFAEMKAAPWLARKVAVVATPSVNAFARLRALPAPAAQRAAFAGFGDPVFSKTAQAAPAGTATRLRSSNVMRLGSSFDATRDAISWSDYASLSPLPDTRDEVQAIAKALGADPAKDVYLGPQASRSAVRSLDLAKRRIVAFATHGLVPGDLPGLTQPALALSAVDDPKDSPLLTLEDVLSLKMDADWVILSACNTAAGDGAGAEAISGLGRGFFYAGSRALLVTHWPVETASARMLVTEVFERYAKDPALSRAQALNRAMLAVMDGPGTPAFSHAHPLFWAPYALVGDGGR